MSLISSREKQPVAIIYCLYARKSMESEERQALSIDSQVKEMNTIAERDNLNVVCIKTESHSAKNSGQRPVFNELISGLKNGTFNAILTWNPDRLSRNAGDLGQIVDLMDRGLLLEIRTYGQVFTNSPNDKFLLMILCSQAKLENDNKSVNVQRGLRTRVEAGLWPASAPMGYLDSNLRDHLCEKGIDPDRAPVIKEIFEKVAYENWTNRQLYFWLKETGVTTQKGKPLNMGGIHDILNRTFYYGKFEYPRKSGKWYQGKHTPIITEELFNLAQQVLDSHCSSKIRKHRKIQRGRFSFSQFMHCGFCGSGITAQEKTKHQKSGKIHRYVYYNCTNGRNRTCKPSYISETELIKQFSNLLDSVNVNLIGMQEELKKGIDNCYEYDSFLNKTLVLERSQEREDSDLRKYAKIIFEDGSLEEKLNIMKHLRGKLLLKDKKVYIDPFTN